MARNRCKQSYAAQLVTTLIALSAISPLGFSVSHAAPGDMLDSAAPDFVLRSVADGNVRLSEYRSDVLVLNFWSDWCGKCTQLLPVLNSLQQQHESAGLQVLTVDVQGDVRSAAETATDLSLQFPILLDEQQQVSRTYDLPRLPVTLVIDREGMVRFVQQGATGEDVEKLTAAVAAAVVE